MNINATFFIQLFHFLIAYCILERFLFRPWVKEIQHEQQQKDEQEALLGMAQQRIAQKEHFKMEQWKEFQTLFAHAMPPVGVELQPSADVWPLLKPTSLMVDAKDSAIDKKEVEQQLVARIVHE